MSIKRFLVLLRFAFLCALAFCAKDDTGHKDKKRVLFLSSYSMQEEAVMMQIRGITSVLPMMNTKFPTSLWMQGALTLPMTLPFFTIYLRSNLTRQSGFDCIITGGDEALQILPPT